VIAVKNANRGRLRTVTTRHPGAQQTAVPAAVTTTWPCSGRSAAARSSGRGCGQSGLWRACASPAGRLANDAGAADHDDDLPGQFRLAPGPCRAAVRDEQPDDDSGPRRKARPRPSSRAGSLSSAWAMLCLAATSAHLMAAPPRPRTVNTATGFKPTERLDARHLIMRDCDLSGSTLESRAERGECVQ
jgi:hypothetical protein